MNELEHIKISNKIYKFFSDNPHLKVINHMEKQLGIPSGTVSRKRKEEKRLPKKHLPKIIEFLRPYGFKGKVS